MFVRTRVQQQFSKSEDETAQSSSEPKSIIRHDDTAQMSSRTEKKISTFKVNRMLYTRESCVMFFVFILPYSDLKRYCNFVPIEII